MLASSAMPNLDAVHSERVMVLDGVDAGKFFNGITDNVSDTILNSELLTDPRGRKMIRFTDKPGNVPSVNTKRLVKILMDGKTYVATKQDFSAYLSVDFELTEIVAGKDS